MIKSDELKKRQLIVWIAPVLLMLFYWRGLDCWFYQDDFGWLHLGPANSFREFLSILFAPKAHGNMRPWSDNLLFYGLRGLFGVNPLPFRIVVFATAMANLFLLFGVVCRLTRGSWRAAVAAQLVWLASPAVSAALCWTCIYNQTQCLFFLLLAFWLYLRGRRVAHVAVFILGLGSLELMVMYPALVLSHMLLFDRVNVLRRVLPLFGISAAFTLLHFVVAPAPKAGPYAIQVDARVLRTLFAYVEMALGPERLGHFEWTWPAWPVPVGTALMFVGVGACAIAGGRAGLLGIAWFVLMLVPVLPLPDHVMDYLLVSPAAGLAITVGSAVASRRWQLGALVCAAYLAFCVPASWKVMTWNRDRSHVARDLVLGVVEYQRQHPDKTLLLTGMSTEQFLAGFADLPFELYGMYNVRLAPGADKAIHDAAGIAPLYVLEEGKARRMIESGAAVVLDVSGGAIREVTRGGNDTLSWN